MGKRTQKCDVVFDSNNTSTHSMQATQAHANNTSTYNNTSTNNTSTHNNTCTHNNTSLYKSLNRVPKTNSGESR